MVSSWAGGCPVGDESGRPLKDIVAVSPSLVIIVECETTTPSGEVLNALSNVSASVTVRILCTELSWPSALNWSRPNWLNIDSGISNEQALKVTFALGISNLEPSAATCVFLPSLGSMFGVIRMKVRLPGVVDHPPVTSVCLSPMSAVKAAVNG